MVWCPRPRATPLVRETEESIIHHGPHHRRTPRHLWLAGRGACLLAALRTAAVAAWPAGLPGCCSCPWLAACWWPSLCLRALLLPPAPVERARAPKATCRAPTLESKFPRHHCVTGATGGSCACTAYRLVRACRRRGRIHDSSSSAGGLQVVGCAIEWHRVLGYVTGRLRQRRCRRVGAARSRNVFVVNGGGAVNVWLASA
jgi:hypothetical protein